MQNGTLRVLKDGTRKYWLGRKLHRIDGPACEWANGNKEWWMNGIPHRIDGPAVEWASGSKEWWIDGIKQDAAGTGFVNSD